MELFVGGNTPDLSRGCNPVNTPATVRYSAGSNVLLAVGKTYFQKADPWPLNPSGEVMLGVKIGLVNGNQNHGNQNQRSQNERDSRKSLAVAKQHSLA